MSETVQTGQILTEPGSPGIIRLNQVQTNENIYELKNTLFRDLLGGPVVKYPCFHSMGCGFDLWMRKVSWRRKWQPTPVFLPAEIPWPEDPGGLQSMGLQKAGHN